MSYLLILTQIIAHAQPSPAYASPEWDYQGKITPEHKISIKELPHAALKEKERSIPFYRMQEKVGGHKESQPLATITPSQNLVMNKTIDGIGYDNVTPPDVQVAAGPINIMEMVNLEGEAWTKDGTPQGQPFDLAAFFGTGSDFISDPKMFYDNSSGRWFASITDVSSGTVDIAVSSTSDATGDYCIYSLKGTNSAILDQPILGSSDDKIVVSANDFDSSTLQFVHAQYWVMSKQDMLSCSPLDFVTKTTASYFSIHPVQSLTDTTTQYMVSTSQTKVGSFVNVFAINGVPPNQVTVSVSQLPVSAISNPPSATQRGTFFRLDSGDYRVQDAVWSNGTLWLAHDNKCRPAGDRVARSCLHLVQLDTRSMSVRQDFDYGMAGKYLFYPALRELPTGGIVLVYGLSSSMQYPQVDVTEQASSDPPNSVEKPTTLEIGKGPVSLLLGCLNATGCRYGDYFGASLDPTNPDLVWVAGEYGSGQLSYSGLGKTWATEIGSFTG